jgi:integrase
MATVRRRDGTGNWQATVRGPDGRTRTFRLKVDAENWLKTQQADVVRGQWVDPALGRTTLKTYAEDWRKRQVHRATTGAQVETNLRRHLYPVFGARRLSSIRASEVQAWVKGLSATLAPATVEVVYRYFVSILRAAVADGVIARNPAAGVKLPKIERPKVTPLPVEHVMALIDAVDDRYRALLITAAGSGLRQGEIFGLTVDHLDQLRRSLRVEQQLVLLPRRPPFLAPPKTEASRRTVPLPDTVVDAIALHLARYQSGPHGLVFTNDRGEPIRRTWFSAEVWRPAIKKAGLPSGTRFHDLRHFYASLLIDAGESVKVVQARLGHASATETLDTYGHLWPDTEDRTRVAVERVLGAANASADRAV